MNTPTKNSARPNVRAIIDGLNLKAAMIAPHYSGLSASLQELASADQSLEEAAWEMRKNELTMAYGFGQSESDKPFAFSNGVAIIPVHGCLVNRFAYSWGYATGYNFIRNQYKAAIGDEDVTLIVFDCNSYGGMVAGCFETVDEIFAGRSEKPSLALVDSNSYSACYAIASAATRMVVVPSAGVGSIGVVAMHVNMGEMLKEYGIEVTFIYAGQHKIDGNPYESLPDNVKKDIQKSIDKTYVTFVNSVARNRNLSADVVKGTEAQTYDADDALTLGLIDAVQTPVSAVAAYLDELSGSDNTQEFEMSKDETKPVAESNTAPDANAIAASARTAERERMAGIIGCDEAKEKSALANHLATKTDMSVDDAKSLLVAAAPEKKEAVAATPQANGFKQAMDASKHPEVGALADDGDAGGAQKSAASRILAAQYEATGRKPATAAN
jgi:signal peptide peptidase SppA